MKTGKRIIAIIETVNGAEPKIEIMDAKYMLVKASDGTLCITESKSQDFYVFEREDG